MRQWIAGAALMLTAVAAQAADPQLGKAKAAVCAACHGANGISIIPDYPNLAGQKVKYLESSIKAYRDGERKNPIMSPMASGLSDADIANLAAFYAGLPAGG
ncbi:c-type cytochrome [Rheinheimera sp. NSM]|uniref:c-type cytochrome n=1 Tax=Rheinheimera sp. NSM TaxID=3457884 RepID=UPI00403560A7